MGTRFWGALFYGVLKRAFAPRNKALVPRNDTRHIADTTTKDPYWCGNNDERSMLVRKPQQKIEDTKTKKTKTIQYNTIPYNTIQYEYNTNTKHSNDKCKCKCKLHDICSHSHYCNNPNVHVVQ
jgi:hypothetical protein